MDLMTCNMQGLAENKAMRFSFTRMLYQKERTLKVLLHLCIEPSVDGSLGSWKMMGTAVRRKNYLNRLLRLLLERKEMKTL